MLECNYHSKGGAIRRRLLKRVIADTYTYHLDKKEEFDIPKHKENVAVVGGGPAGLMCAYDLSKRGYRVTIFEASNRIDGALWLIPRYRLPEKTLVSAMDNLVRIAGIDVKYNAGVGGDTTVVCLECEDKSSKDGIPADFEEIRGAWEEGVRIIYSRGVRRIFGEGERIKRIECPKCTSVFSPAGFNPQVEAPRGTIFHHYETDDQGLLTMVNLVVASLHNAAPICVSVKKAAQEFITSGRIQEGLLNRVEMAFRAYDPCLGCATHALSDHRPPKITIRDPARRVVQTL